jgi:alkanesulfonate monooxygenase SsuD/methylene tetrahydromethanopterin reductase-like flavin-dependent oxidoreductase (luciferase family)
MLDREGADGPSDVAIVGAEDEVLAQLGRLAEVGATDFLAAVVGTAEELERTVDLLASLAED